MDVPASLLDFPLIRGARVRAAAGRPLARPRRAAVFRRALVLSWVSWLPLLALALLFGGPTVRSAFLRDVAVHVQLLVSLPLLIAAEHFIGLSLAAAVRQFVVSELVDAKHLTAYEDLARRAVRARSRASVEVGLLLASYALSFVGMSFHATTPDWVHEARHGPLTLAGGWYLAVAMPLFRFLVLRWLWQGILWALFLFRVSRLPLTLVPTHPDSTGGLGFLGTCQASFAVLVLAVGCTLTAQRLRWAPSADLTGYATHLLAFALLCLVVLFAPLLPFCRPLLEAKRHGDHAFTAVAAWHSRRFERRWFHREEPAGHDPLSAPDFSSLADLGTAFTTARDMRWLPVDFRAALAILCAAMAPLVPLLFIDRRFLDVVMAVGKSLF